MLNPLRDVLEVLLGLLPESYERRFLLAVLVVTGLVCLGLAVRFLVRLAQASDSAALTPSILFGVSGVLCLGLAARVSRLG